MKTYARVDQGSVTELFVTDGNIAALFHRDVRWIDVTQVTEIACGWRYDGMHFNRPPPDSVASDAAARAAPGLVMAEPSPSPIVAHGGSVPDQTSGG
jgi:hypothetical protein